MNVVIYAGDNKYFKTLLPIVRELKQRSINFFFMFNDETELKFPLYHPSSFYYDTNVTTLNPPGVDCLSLGVKLPFIPDYLILARERWQPEQTIIHEFKTKFNSIIACVEVSTHIVNNIENRLEMLSRAQYPQNLVDYFFEHSEYAKQRRIDCLDSTYAQKSIVVGNPRFSGIKPGNKDLYKLYELSPGKKKILFWGVINTTRPQALKALENLVDKFGQDYDIFYKPYPGEPYNPRFIKEFTPSFYLKDVRVIYSEDDIFDIASLCDLHIGAISSTFNFGFYFNKPVIYLDSVTSPEIHMNNIDTFLQEKRNGVEDSALFWMNIWKLSNQQEFIDLVNLGKVELFKKTNEHLLSIVRSSLLPYDWECSFLHKEPPDSSILRKAFDSYGMDEKAPERIVDFIQNNYKTRYEKN